MKKQFSKIIALVLSLTMLFSVAPLSVFANTENVKGTSDVLDYTSVKGTADNLDANTVMGEIEGDNLTQGNDDIIIKVLTRNLSDTSQTKETDQVSERFDLSKPAIIDGVCGGTTEASYNSGFARKLPNGDERSIMCAYDAATNKYFSNTSKQYSIDIIVDLGTKYDISGLLISSSYTDVLGDYDIFVSNTQDVFSADAVASYTFDTDAATQEERNNQGINTWKTKSGKTLAARYIGIRVYEVNTRPATVGGKWYFDRIRINEIAVYGTYHFEPSASLDDDISDNDGIADSVNSSSNIVKELPQTTLNNSESFKVENTNGVVSTDYSAITNGAIDDAGVEVSNGTKVTFSFINATDITNMLMSFNTTSAAYNIYASNTRDTLYTPVNLKQKYTGSNLAQYYTFNSTESVKYVGVEFLGNAKINEIALIGPARTIGNEIYYDSEAIKYYDSMLKSNLNLMKIGYPGSDEKGVAGTMYIDGMYKGNSERKGYGFQTYYTENDMTDGDPNSHTDVSLNTTTGRAVFRENGQWCENTYVDIVITMAHTSEVEALYFAWASNAYERVADYEVFALGENGNIDTLYSSENQLFRIDDNTNSSISKKQVYTFKKPTQIKYVGIRIHKGVQESCNHNYTFPRVAEIAAFGYYTDIDRYDYTIKSSVDGIVNESGWNYEDSKEKFTAPLTKNGYSFKKWTVNGNDASGEILRKENKATLDIKLDGDKEIVAVYENDPNTLVGGDFYIDRAKGLIAVPNDTFARDLYLGFENYRNNVAVNKEITPATYGQKAVTGMTVSALVDGTPAETLGIVTEGDANLDGDLSVTDLVSGIGFALNNTADLKETFATDSNRDGKITVSDIVISRNTILNQNDEVYDEYTEKFTKIEDIEYKYMGRECVNNPGTSDASVVLEMASRGIVFNANFMGDLQLEVSAQHAAFKYFTVVVDGVENHEVKIALSKPNTREFLTIAEDIEPGNHTVEVYTQTESGVIDIYGAKMYGETVERPKDKDLYIEFIGDSITCGMGNLVNAPDVDGLRHQNSYLSYGSQTARLLDADWCNVSHSGSTVVPAEATHMPTEYLKITKHKNNLYDFTTARKPDIVVINLGTNDNGIISNRADREEYFESHVESFARLIWEKNGPQVKIVFAFGMMTPPNFYINQCYERVAAKLKGEGYDVYYCALEKDMTGGANHPSVAGDTRNAIILSNFIKENVLD